jgi:hypothetical protein
MPQVAGLLADDEDLRVLSKHSLYEMWDLVAEYKP